jgi:thiamine biosynthesis lipoprotein
VVSKASSNLITIFFVLAVTGWQLPGAPAAPVAGSYEFTQIHMGLPVRLLIHAADESRARRAARAAFARIASLDRMMSDYRRDSELRRLEHQGGAPVPVSRELFAVVERAVEIARASDGAFDPTVGPLVALWRDTRLGARLPPRSAVDRARASVGWRHLALDSERYTVRFKVPGMRLDLGGIAKGYILQEALAALRLLGVTRAMVEAGGDIVVGDAPPGRPGWSVQAAGADAAFRERASSLVNAALATSGPTAQFVEIDGVRYSHVLDPRTGLGLTNGIAARVIADDGATADALATALTVVGHEGADALLDRFPGVLVSLSR